MKNPFTAFFNKAKQLKARFSRWKEIGGFNSTFSPFGADAYKSDIVRACIRPLAEQTSKASPVCKDERIKRLLEYRPNIYMTGHDFLSKVRTQYELKNTAFIVIMRDLLGKVIGLYPMPYTAFEALEDESGHLYIKFKNPGGDYIFAWEDVIVMRKDYNQHDIAGDDNSAILDTLELISTSNQGIANAVKSTANLRGIVKYTKTMIDPKDLKKQRDEFVKQYMTLENCGGIAALDSSMEFEPLNLSPTVINWATMKEFRENVYRYFGVSEAIVTSTASPEEMQSFYELKIEPFLIALALEMTSKIFTEREISFGKKITFASSTIQWMSMQDKLGLRDAVDRGALTPNEWREVLGLPPIDGGDEPIRRLDTAPVSKIAQSISDGKEDEDDQ